jgi:small conductance mechanosensitive channel
MTDMPPALGLAFLQENIISGTILAATGLLAGCLASAAARATIGGILAVIGENISEGTAAALRRTVARAGWLLTIGLVVGAAGVTGYYILNDHSLGAAASAAATPERLRATGIAAAEVLGLLIAAAIAGAIVRRLMARLEALVPAERAGLSPAAVKRTFASIVALMRTLIYAEAVVLSVGAAGADTVWVDRGHIVLALVAIALGATLVARISGLLLESLASFLADAPEKGALRYFVRLRGLLSIGKRAAELTIYVYAARLFVAGVDPLRPLGALGEKIIATILYALLARVVVEVVALVVEDFLLEKPADVSEETAAAAAAAESKARTFVPIVRSLASYFIYFFAGIAVMEVWGIDPKPILASAGILGLAVGLGAQKLTGDLVAGFFILFEGMYFVGHYIVIGDKEGMVESITIRTTAIRDAKGVLHVIPNGSVNVVSNYSTGFVDAVLDVGLAYDADFARVRGIVEAVGKRLDAEFEDVLAPTSVEGVVDVTGTDAVLRTRTRVRPGRHEWAKCALRERLKEALDAAKVPIKALKG